MTSYSFKAKVWKYPGMGGWHFVDLPDKFAKGIRDKFGKGMHKIPAEVGKSKWKATLLPFKNPKGDIGYLIAIVAKIRKEEGIMENDNIKLSFKI